MLATVEKEFPKTKRDEGKSTVKGYLDYFVEVVSNIVCFCFVFSLIGTLSLVRLVRLASKLGYQFGYFMINSSKCIMQYA